MNETKRQDGGAKSKRAIPAEKGRVAAAAAAKSF